MVTWAGGVQGVGGGASEQLPGSCFGRVGWLCVLKILHVMCPGCMCALGVVDSTVGCHLWGSSDWADMSYWPSHQWTITLTCWRFTEAHRLKFVSCNVVCHGCFWRGANQIPWQYPERTKPEAALIHLAVQILLSDPANTSNAEWSTVSAAKLWQRPYMRPSANSLT